MGTKIKPAPFDCYANALPDEPLFTLLARDKSAPDLVRAWASKRAREVEEGIAPFTDMDAVAEADTCAASMERWRQEAAGKWRRRKQLYVLGFLFTDDFSHVLLQLKNRPAFAAGKLNGVGGKVKETEPPEYAMHREWYEETGERDIRPWVEFAHVAGPDFYVICYRTCADYRHDMLRVPYLTNPPDDPRFEELHMLRTSEVMAMHNGETMANLRVLLALAMDESGIVRPVILTDDVSNARLRP